jgi:hypothetical protein
MAKTSTQKISGSPVALIVIGSPTSIGGERARLIAGARKIASFREAAKRLGGLGRIVKVEYRNRSMMARLVAAVDDAGRFHITTPFTADEQGWTLA